MNILDYHTLKAVFKGSPTKTITFKAGHLGDREDWEEGLLSYITYDLKLHIIAKRSKIVLKQTQ